MISVSVVGIAALMLALVVLGVMTYLNDRRSGVNQVFAMICLSSGIYSVLNVLTDHNQQYALLWARLTFFVVTPLLYLVLVFAARFPRPTISAKRLWWLSIIPIGVSALTLSSVFISGVVIEPGLTDIVPGPAYSIFTIYFLASFIAIMFLIVRSYRRSVLLERVRVALMLYSLVVTIALISLTNLFLPLIEGSNPLAELGSYFLIIFIGASYYAIVRQRLFNLRLVVVRTTTYLLLVTVMAVTYIGAVTALTAWMVHDSSNQTLQIAISTALAVVLALSFQTLRNLFERVTDRIFYRYHYDTQAVLADFSTVLVRELELDSLLKRSLHQICRDLDINYAQLVVFKDDRVDRVEHYGRLPERLMVAPQLKLLNKAVVVADELEAGERKELLEGHGLRVSAMMRTHEGTIGYLLLGDKLSGDIYTSQDINVIGIMAKELAVAISNAQSYSEIQLFAATLQDRVNHATSRLRVANRHLKELDRVKDEFISMASHQLRTPLTTIKGYLSMLLEGDAGELTDDQKEFIDYAFSGSERMVRLISDLLDVSRLSAGRFIIQPRPTDIVKLVQEEVTQLRQHAESKGLELIEVMPSSPLPLMMLDDTKTRQVIMNFIDNAIYYTKEGSVTVLLNLKRDNIRFEVRDTGIGVPESAKRHLFTKFYRADNAQNTRPDGTGLGIYLAKRVVEDQGGTIVFSSTEGKGSIFGFELPLVPAPASATTTNPKKTPITHG